MDRIRIAYIFAFFVLLLMSAGNVHASFTDTNLSTTVFLTNSTTAHVVEGIQLYISNTSVSAYDQDRQTVNSTLTQLQTVIGNTPFLAQHILNPKSSIRNFIFLPGPVIPAANGAGYASLTMSYDVPNVTSVVSIAPRQFEYSFNGTVLNFLHTSSGQVLLANTRLTIMVPNGTQIVNIFPLPDYPQPNSFGKYNGTSYSWFSGEPLNNFNFVYITKQTPQQEVLQYFSGVYNRYGTLIYALVALAIIAIAFYIYTKVFR